MSARVGNRIALLLAALLIGGCGSADDVGTADIDALVQGIVRAFRENQPGGLGPYISPNYNFNGLTAASFTGASRAEEIVNRPFDLVIPGDVFYVAAGESARVETNQPDYGKFPSQAFGQVGTVTLRFDFTYGVDNHTPPGAAYTLGRWAATDRLWAQLEVERTVNGARLVAFRPLILQESRNYWFSAGDPYADYDPAGLPSTLPELPISFGDVRVNDVAAGGATLVVGDLTERAARFALAPGAAMTARWTASNVLPTPDALRLPFGRLLFRPVDSPAGVDGQAVFTARSGDAVVAPWTEHVSAAASHAPAPLGRYVAQLWAQNVRLSQRAIAGQAPGRQVTEETYAVYVPYEVRQ